MSEERKRPPAETISAKHEARIWQVRFALILLQKSVEVCHEPSFRVADANLGVGKP
jgi:hypothetical protein